MRTNRPLSQQLRFLIVEDEEINCWLLQLQIADTATEVHIAHDGATAVRLAEMYRPDIILMDIQLPVMDGINATRWIRSLYSPIIIAVTALNDHRSDWLKLGFDGVVGKPYTSKKLHQIIAQNYIASTQSA